MRRLTILLATVGALMLVPVAQATAETAKVNIVGTGSGEVISEADEFPYESAGTPPIACTYNGTSTSGVCENTPGETFKESFYYAIKLVAKPAPGSEIAGWAVQKGTGHELPVGLCPFEPSPSETFPETCLLASEEEEEELEVTVTFCLGTCPVLTVATEGTGLGTVVSNPSGIECGTAGTACTKKFEQGTKVTLTASPGPSSTFVSWKGCDKGGVNGRQCTVTMSEAKNVSAKFTKTYNVGVTRVGTGLGKVSSSPGGVLCLSNCSSTNTAFKEGTSVTLSAAPSKNYVFTEWTGACSGFGTCSLTMDANKTVGAKFTAVAQHKLILGKSGGGNGTVKSNLAGINCGAICSSMTAAYFQGQEVELTATPGKGSTFGGWSGDCSGTGTCKVALSKEKTVNAEFK